MILHSAKYHNFPYAGLISNGSLSSVGSEGRYWSRTASATFSDDVAYNLYFNSSYVIPTSRYDRYYGFSIRCVATT